MSPFITRITRITRVTRNKIFALTIGLALVSATAAGAALTAPRDAHVVFEAAGPAGMKIEGRTSDLSVEDGGGNVVIAVSLANLGTGIALRDRHMKEKYLEVAKYPDASLVVARSALKFPANGAQAEGDAPAILKLHGQARPVTIHYEANGDRDGFSVRGAFRLKMDDFGITIPSYLGVTVKPDVDVHADFHLTGT
jgi:polyisoprenoid-binding protein YceI